MDLEIDGFAILTCLITPTNCLFILFPEADFVVPLTIGTGIAAMLPPTSIKHPGFTAVSFEEEFPAKPSVTPDHKL
jgi:hypothetical protein